MKRLVIYFTMTRQAALIRPAALPYRLCRNTAGSYSSTKRYTCPADRVWVRQSGAAASNGKRRFRRRRNNREALLTLGREKLAEYEEIVLMNYTLAGPVCSLAAMFTAMDAARSWTSGD